MHGQFIVGPWRPRWQPEVVRWSNLRLHREAAMRGPKSHPKLCLGQPWAASARDKRLPAHVARRLKVVAEAIEALKTRA